MLNERNPFIERGSKATSLDVIKADGSSIILETPSTKKWLSEEELTLVSLKASSMGLGEYSSWLSRCFAISEVYLELISEPLHTNPS